MVMVGGDDDMYVTRNSCCMGGQDTGARYSMRLE